MISVEKLTKKYYKKNEFSGDRDEIYAIRDVSFTVEPGEILGVAGLSGSGKTTLLRCMLQLTKPDGGSVHFKNQDLTQLNDEELRRQVRPFLRKVYQHPESVLNPGLTVRKIVEQPVLLYEKGMDLMDRTNRVNQLLTEVGLPVEYEDKYPHQLSGGEKRRLALARAIATNPEVLIADEPFAGLDKALQYRMLNLLIGLKNMKELTMVMVSHDIDVIKHVCDRIIILKDGKLADIAVAGIDGVDVDMKHFMQ